MTITITITKLYELLSNKMGKDEALHLTTERHKSAIVSELKAEIEKVKAQLCGQ